MGEMKAPQVSVPPWQTPWPPGISGIFHQGRLSICHSRSSSLFTSRHMLKMLYAKYVKNFLELTGL